MAQGESVDDYLNQSLETLLETSVTSVSKKKEEIKDTSASVYVVSQEQIQRSGFQTLPDVLSMVPGVQVSRIDSNTWVISARGFDDIFANKLLVLQDGRTLYSPVYSGVYWDTQTLPLEEIERIEVIRGPGSVIWGANAVNGVVNIITKKADATQGTKLQASVAYQARDELYIRHGFAPDESTQARIYLGVTQHDSHELNDSTQSAFDSGDAFQTGFRIDKSLDRYNWTLQGEYHEANQNQLIDGLVTPFSHISALQQDQVDASGWSLLSLWEHYGNTVDGNTSSSFQFYIDHQERKELVLEQEYTTFDVEFINRQPLGSQHELTWGLGYRHIWDEYRNSFRVSVNPDTAHYYTFNAFVQDSYSVSSHLNLTFGSKLEAYKHYDAEISPSIRMHWDDGEASSVWGGISRAVHIPGRFERDGNITAALVPVSFTPPVLETVTVNGSNSLKPEYLIAYEAGYRSTFNERLSLDAAFFYHDYDQLVSYEISGFNTTFDSRMEAYSYGTELAVNWRSKEWWQLMFGYSYIEVNASPHQASTDTVSASFIEGNTGQSQFKLASWMDLSNDLSFDVLASYRSALEKTQPNTKDTKVKSQTSLNARLSWQVNNNFEVSLIGQNLLNKETLQHTGSSFIPSAEIGRSFFAEVELSF